jgi:hypothetical protein
MRDLVHQQGKHPEPVEQEHIMNRNAEIAAAREADEKIAAAWGAYYAVADKAAMTIKLLKSYRAMSTNNADRITELEARLEVERAEAKTIREAAVELNKNLYTGWQRFFLVKHIHASQECSSFRPTTQIGWLPNLSGLSEYEAVQEHGAILCTICFPTAPTAWTEGKKEEGICAGAGQPVDLTKLTGREKSYYSPTGTCSACGKVVGLTARGSGKARKHKVA